MWKLIYLVYSFAPSYCLHPSTSSLSVTKSFTSLQMQQFRSGKYTHHCVWKVRSHQMRGESCQFFWLHTNPLFKEFRRRSRIFLDLFEIVFIFEGQKNPPYKEFWVIKWHVGSSMQGTTNKAYFPQKGFKAWKFSEGSHKRFPQTFPKKISIKMSVFLLLPPSKVAIFLENISNIFSNTYFHEDTKWIWTDKKLWKFAWNYLYSSFSHIWRDWKRRIKRKCAQLYPQW